MDNPLGFGIRDYRMTNGDTIKIGCPSELFFGDSLHPTTIATARVVESISLSGKSVIDLGAGTGTLAIVAARMGAHRVVGIDNHPLALICGMFNAHINNADIQFELDDILGLHERSSLRYDVVVMNYIMNDRAMADVINKLMWESALSLVKTPGIVVTSEMKPDNPEWSTFFPRRFDSSKIIHTVDGGPHWQAIAIST